MEILNVYSISGLFYELYSPNVQLYNCNPLDFTSGNPLYRLNALFWAELFSEKNVDCLFDALDSSSFDSLSEIEKAVLANKKLFKSLINKAPLNIINQAISEHMMFSYMEQIEIACKLFSKYLFYPFSLTIQDGFQEPSLSSKALIISLFDKTKNPYLPFLEQNVFWQLKQVHPKMIWINGQPKQSSLAIAAYIKELNPDVFIAVRYHSSEYFSLNKIDELLMNNCSLFSLVDCVVLDDSLETCKHLEEIVCNSKAAVGNCRNIIYVDRSVGKIFCSKTEKVEYSFEESTNVRLVDNTCMQDYISPHEVMNLKLNPNTACYWNKCSFCAINKKYKFIKNEEQQSLDEKLNYIEKCIAQGIRYFWFEDEAIPPHKLDAFANAVLNRGLEFRWQVRSRIDMDFTEELAKKLYHAGMREIRFGLESANIRILKLMNKFPENISLDVVENIVRFCTRIGIHVHFPMIVGFPSERVEERIETYTFLSTLRNRYKNVSYNINVLMLDVASDLFKNFQKYNISSIRFPCSPSEFLGNMVDFDCLDTLEGRESIDIKRNEFMRDTLYPWMPITAQIKPNIFYRLSETIRNTLIWCCNPEQMEYQLPKEADFYTKNKYLSEWKDSDEYYRVYDWVAHRLYQFPCSHYEDFVGLKMLTSSEVKCSPFYQALCQNGLLIPTKE